MLVAWAERMWPSIRLLRRRRFLRREKGLELGEGQRPVGQRQLPLRRHFSEGFGLAFGHEDRIVAEAPLAAWRPDKLTAHDPLETLDMPVRPGKRKHADEARPAVDLAVPVCLRLKAVLDLLHGEPEVFRGTGPAGRINAGRAGEPIAGEPGIV